MSSVIFDIHSDCISIVGKGNEDKRGQPITQTVCFKHWLYLNGYGVVCSRQMEVAAIVSGINPSISATIDSVEMGSLQQVFSFNYNILNSLHRRIIEPHHTKMCLRKFLTK